MQYSDLTTRLAAEIPQTLVSASGAAPFSDSNWNTALTEMIEYAENRIYRDPEFDMLANYDSATTTATANTRTIAKPTALILSEQANVIVPASDNPNASNSTRNPLFFVSKQVLDYIWPVAPNATGTTGLPEYIAPQDDTNYLLAPTPDQAYVVEFYGTIQPTPMSSTNTTTPLGTAYPELFWAAVMIRAAGFMRAYGQQADDPKLAMSWETVFQSLHAVSVAQERRKKGLGPASAESSTGAKAP